jgi:hypothetical protein
VGGWVGGWWVHSLVELRQNNARMKNAKKCPRTETLDCAHLQLKWTIWILKHLFLTVFTIHAGVSRCAQLSLAICLASQLYSLFLFLRTCQTITIIILIWHFIVFFLARTCLKPFVAIHLRRPSSLYTFPSFDEVLDFVIHTCRWMLKVSFEIFLDEFRFYGWLKINYGGKLQMKLRKLWKTFWGVAHWVSGHDS